MMKRRTYLLSLCLVAMQALADTTDVVERSSSPGGIRIRGETAISAGASNLGAAAVGSDNTARNAVGAVRDDVRIQGNTRIDVRAQNINAVAAGKNSNADNSVGTIGGK